MIEIFTRPEQHWFWRVVGFLIRVRAELVLLAVILTAWLWTRALLAPPELPEQSVTDPAVIDPVIGPVAEPAMSADLIFVIGVAALTVVVVAVPATRRFAVRRVWCVITRHRMRACFKRTRGAIHHGKLPYLWWSRPSPVGERVRVWLPAGLSVKDVQNITDELATACWAREARITPSRSQAASMVIDIVRRDPLTRSKPVTPTVADGLDAPWHHDHGDPEPLPDRSTVATPDPIPIPAPRPAPGSSTNGHKRPERRTPPDPGEHAPEPEVAGFGGVDVSDYI